MGSIRDAEVVVEGLILETVGVTMYRVIDFKLQTTLFEGSPGVQTECSGSVTEDSNRRAS